MKIVTKIGLLMIASGFPVQIGFLLLRSFLKQKHKHWFAAYGISAKATLRIIAVKKIHHTPASRNSDHGLYKKDWDSWDVIEAVSYMANGRPMVKEYTRRDGRAEDKVGDTRDLTLFYDPHEPEYTSLSKPKSYSNMIFRCAEKLTAICFIIGMLLVVEGGFPGFGFAIVGFIGLILLARWWKRVKADKQTKHGEAQVAK
jgi:hypothetical protein